MISNIRPNFFFYALLFFSLLFHFYFPFRLDVGDELEDGFVDVLFFWEADLLVEEADDLDELPLLCLPTLPDFGLEPPPPAPPLSAPSPPVRSALSFRVFVADGAAPPLPALLFFDGDGVVDAAGGAEAAGGAGEGAVCAALDLGGDLVVLVLFLLGLGLVFSVVVVRL